MSDVTRRRALSLLSGVAATAACAPGTVSAPAAPSPPSLRDLAAAKGIVFGTAMSARQVRDPDYVRLVLADCAGIVAENEHKMYVIQPQPDVWRWGPVDSLIGFARENGLAMRGHTLVWHHPRWLPDWVNETTFPNAAEAEALLGNYIKQVAGRDDGLVHSWDVVNETIDSSTGDQRETSFSRAMGPEVIEFCFHKAREAAPGAKLAYNDYMSWEAGMENHRTGVLRLLERLRKNGAPIDALGIQSHSNTDMPTEFTAEKQRAWRAFMDDVTGMGLEIYMTEFDVNDTQMDADIAYRDREIAAYTRDYLDLMLSYPQVKEVLMWGLVDLQSWL
ncbi:MAG: endo-1,4-beta-xylanase [Hyphomonas sp.]